MLIAHPYPNISGIPNGTIKLNRTFNVSKVYTYPSVEYNYTIITGSYPQIHHDTSLLTTNGWINCTEFADANGKKYDDWIPAIKLE